MRAVLTSQQLYVAAVGSLSATGQTKIWHELTYVSDSASTVMYAVRGSQQSHHHGEDDEVGRGEHVHCQGAC